MVIDMATMLTVGALTTGLVQVLKGIPKLRPIMDDYVQVIALAISIVLGLTMGLWFIPSLMAGLMSMGLYDAGASAVEKMKDLTE